MVEQTIKGIVEAWGQIKAGVKSNGETYTYSSVKIAGNWHKFFDDANTLKARIESAPTGSEVEFIEWKKQESDQYWNQKKDSFKVIKKGASAAPKPQTGNYDPLNDKTQRLIVFQTMIKAAVELEVAGHIPLKEVIPTAYEMADAAFKYARNETKKEEVEPEPDPVPVEDIEEGEQ